MGRGTGLRPDRLRRMNMVVLPMSSAAVGPPSAIVVANGLLIHALGVGIPSALTARAVWSVPLDSFALPVDAVTNRRCRVLGS